MSKHPLILELEKEQKKSDLTHFSVGDTIRVHRKIVEGGKERIQALEGTVISKKGSSLSETFTIYRIAHGYCMEVDFKLHSPQVVKIERLRCGDVRRAKLYYLRGKKGKKARVREKILSKSEREKLKAKSA